MSSEKIGMKSELELIKIPAAELAKRDEDVPAYKVQCDYTEDQIKRLRDEIFDGYERLKKERKDKKLEEKWDSEEAQYAGQMDDDNNLEFNLNVPVTKVKCDTVERLAIKALTESDPKFTVTARPATAKMDKWDVTVNAQSDYLDYKLDEEIELISPLRKTIHQAVLHDVGFLKVPYEYRTKPKKREEHYSAARDPQTGQCPDLVSFIKTYPESVNESNVGHWVIKDLLAGKDAVFTAKFDDPVYDDPNPSFVSIRDLFTSCKAEGYNGLCNERLIIERQDYSWWELKKLEKNGDFINIDKCKIPHKDEKDAAGEQKADDDYKTRDNEIIECTYWFNEVGETVAGAGDEDVEDEEKIICWFHVRSKQFIGSIYYPYDIVECVYIPFYVKDKTPGLYKGGIAEDLTHSNTAQNAILNFMLTEVWMQLQTTPIVKEGSAIANQFLDKRWKPGIPLFVPPNTMSLTSDLGFLEKPQRAVAQQIIPVLHFLSKFDADSTGITDAASTGANDPTDPTAPGTKTIALLKQSGINISDYIACLVPSFNKIGEIILGLTYQMTQEGRPFKQRQRQQQVVGGPVFAEITRDQMIAKTNIQSRAAGFDFDKINEKRENLALFQILRMDPLVPPSGVYAMAKFLVQSWSPLWKNKVDEILPDPQTFQQGQLQLCVQALQTYIKGLLDQSKVTGVSQQPDLKQFLTMATQMASQAMTPPPKQAGQPAQQPGA